MPIYTVIQSKPIHDVADAKESIEDYLVISEASFLPGFWNFVKDSVIVKKETNKITLTTE
ncbi:unnamed protein product [Sphenostylis stenocarpa]|uniref:Uncharacterized protein n=1 Tax=Sphenostylis stenocarpa TaxID=92480 RepID=A0AA86V9L0_9FABA|nr:unnamed protein product [Sphenostylis stenocarpa]